MSTALWVSYSVYKWVLCLRLCGCPIENLYDTETAEIAIQASLTGHLVLSTLHTNDATSAFTRLLAIVGRNGFVKALWVSYNSMNKPG